MKVWLSFKNNWTNKKRVRVRTQLSFKNWREIEICIRNNWKEWKPVIKLFINKLSVVKKYWNKNKINCSDRRNKSKDSINKSLFWKNREIVIHSKLLRPRPNTFIPEIKSNWEITLLLNFRNRTLKLKPN